MASNARVQLVLQYPPEDNTNDVQISRLIDVTGFTEKVDSTYQLAVGVGQVLSLGSVSSAKALYMSTDEDISVYINGATTPFVLAADSIMCIAGGATEITDVSVDVTVDPTHIRLWAVE